MKFIALYKIGWRIFATTEVQAEVLAQKKASFDNPLLDVSEYRGIIGATKFTVPGPWQYNGGTAERAGENHGKE